MDATVATQQYIDNSAYNTLASARLYEQAIRVLLILKPTKVVIDGNVVEHNLSVLRDELSRVRSYVANQESKQAASQGQSGAVRVYDMTGVRD